MLFNSWTFALFFGVFYGVYWLANARLPVRNVLILLGSYVFYGWWDWRFLSLIAVSTLVDYVCGLGIHAAADPRRRRAFLIVSVTLNLGLLATFKYFGFFVDSFTDLAAVFGWQVDFVTRTIILPIGISFYTFQTMTYTIDIYRGQLTPTRNVVNFAAFVAFFPQLVAGPIERAATLLPQIERRAVFSFDQSRDGLFLVLWGLFKKVMIADRLSVYVDAVYGAPDQATGLHCLLATIFFGIQIYGDFSGYSDIARGLAKLLGTELMVNFNTPYLAVSLRDFWRRWHISLSTWFRDYLYIPLGGSRSARMRHRLNLLITFTVSGLWHGAAYTFVTWGFVHGVLYVLDPFSRRRRKDLHPVRERWLRGLGLVVTYILVTLTRVFFRADTMGDAMTVFRRLGAAAGQLPHASAADLRVAMSGTEFFLAWYLIAILVVIDWLVKDKQIDRFAASLPTAGRWALGWFLTANFLLFGASHAGPFIYFQF